MILPNSMRIGVCACGESVEQHQIDPKWLATKSDGVRDTLRREFMEDASGNLFIPKHCQSHSSRSVA